MKLFLVSGTVTKTYYNSDRSKATNALKIVHAENSEDAERKFLGHYESLGSDYDDYYTVHNINVEEAI